MSGALFEVSPVEIVRDAEMQPRKRLDDNRVEVYRRRYLAALEMPPVRVWRSPEGTLVLIDGWHRVEGAVRAGASRIKAEIVEGIDRAEACKQAALANLSHGLSLTREERQRALELAWPGYFENMPVRTIAAELGVSKSNVQRWINQLGLSRPQGEANSPKKPFDVSMLHPIDSRGELREGRAGPYLQAAAYVDGLRRLYAGSTLNVVEARKLAYERALTMDPASISEALKALRLALRDVQRLAEGQQA